MPRRSANFTPPPRRPESSPAITLFVEPEDPIRIMGEMIRDADLVQEKLRGLAFADEHYRADLRVIRGVAVRMADRCARLLGEIDDTKEAEALQYGEDLPPADPEALKTARDGIRDAVAREDFGEALAGPTTPALPHRRNGTAPKPPAPEKKKRGRPRAYHATDPLEQTETKMPLVVQIAQLLKAGPKSTGQLIEHFRGLGDGRTAEEIKAALARLRIDEEIITKQEGPLGAMNYLAATA